MLETRVRKVHGRPGHAVIEIPYALDVDPLLLTIQKLGADRRYLARDGSWRSESDALQPQKIERQGGATLVYVGPEIVNCIDEDERLRIGIEAASFTGDLVWSDIPPSSGGTGRSVFLTRPKVVAAPTPAPAPEMKAEPAPLPPPLTVPEAVPPPPPPPRRTALWGVLAALLLFVVAGVAYWVLRPQPAPVALAPPPLSETEELARLRQQLADMIQRGDDPGRILDGARRLIDSPDAAQRDFGFRAMDYAATRGSASAQLEMGRLFDPRTFKVGRGAMEKANPSMAAEWYKRAADSGSREAPAETKALCESLDDQQRTTLAQYCK